MIPEETVLAKALPTERVEAGKKEALKAPPDERVRLKAAQRRSPQVGEEDVQASKPLVEGRQKYPRLQEQSKQSSRRRHFIPEDPLQAKAPPTERVEAGKKEAAKTLPEERVRLQAVQTRSPQVGQEDVQTSKPLAEGMQKYPRLQEISKQSSRRKRLIPEETLQTKAAAKKRAPKAPPGERVRLQAAQRAKAAQESSRRRRFITEEDDEMFPCNVDPFSEDIVAETQAAESDQSSRENCF